MTEKQKVKGNSAFERVVGYFLGHEKPKDEPADKMLKKAPLSKGKGPAQPKKVTRPAHTKPRAKPRVAKS